MLWLQWFRVFEREMGRIGYQGSGRPLGLKMNVIDFGKFSSSFGLIEAPSKLVAESFLVWQQEILRQWSFKLKLEQYLTKLGDALDALFPRTAPIATKYLF